MTEAPADFIKRLEWIVYREGCNDGERVVVVCMLRGVFAQETTIAPVHFENEKWSKAVRKALSKLQRTFQCLPRTMFNTRGERL